MLWEDIRYRYIWIASRRESFHSSTPRLTLRSSARVMRDQKAEHVFPPYTPASGLRYCTDWMVHVRTGRLCAPSPSVSPSVKAVAPYPQDRYTPTLVLVLALAVYGLSHARAQMPHGRRKPSPTFLGRCIPGATRLRGTPRPRSAADRSRGARRGLLAARMGGTRAGAP